MQFDKPIFVTQPTMPPLEEYNEYLKKIWESKNLTNNGQFHRELEQALCNYLGVKYISLFSNGTLALITALQVLNIKGEVITTPFSFVATAHSLIWNGITPVFCDIESAFFNLDSAKIEALITPNTTAIMPVHVYGNPCDMDAIQAIADKYNLKVIYDAAHSFGVKNNGESILNHGDLSVLSFHATKVFNTFEGGAIVCHDAETKKQIDYLKNFGFEDEITVVGAGINAKMNEVQAAFGLLQLKCIDENIAKRKKIAEQYRSLLMHIKGINFLDDIEYVHHNYSYFPILINEKIYGKSRDDLYNLLKEDNIFTRRYFYPLITDLSPYKEMKENKTFDLPVAKSISEKVLCLPIYADLEKDSIDAICSIIRK